MDKIKEVEPTDNHVIRKTRLQYFSKEKAHQQILNCGWLKIRVMYPKIVCWPDQSSWDWLRKAQAPVMAVMAHGKNVVAEQKIRIGASHD